MLAHGGLGLEGRDGAGCLNHTGFISVSSHGDVLPESTGNDI